MGMVLGNIYVIYFLKVFLVVLKIGDWVVLSIILVFV